MITQVRKHATYAHLHILYATFLFICNAVGKKRVLSHIKIKKKYARYRKIRPSLSGLMKVLEKKATPPPRDEERDPCELEHV